MLRPTLGSRTANEQNRTEHPTCTSFEFRQDLWHQKPRFLSWATMQRSLRDLTFSSFDMDGPEYRLVTGRLKTQVRKTKVPEDEICKYGIRKYEYARVENASRKNASTNLQRWKT